MVLTKLLNICGRDPVDGMRHVPYRRANRGDKGNNRPRFDANNGCSGLRSAGMAM
jgi:hypothetical protein